MSQNGLKLNKTQKSKFLVVISETRVNRISYLERYVLNIINETI